MLKFGMPALLELLGLEACTSFCERQGLDFLELNMNLPEYQPEVLDPDLLRRLALHKGIGLTVHLDETLNVCDFNSDIARAAQHTVQKTLELAARLEIPILNLHLPSGVYFTLPEGKVWLFDRYQDHYLRQMEQLRQMCSQYAGAGVTVCAENCGGFHRFQQEALELLLESPVFGLTLDVGHDFRAQGADRLFMERYSGRIVHLHLHDSDGQQDHLPLGEGQADLLGALELAERRNCRVVLEVKTADGLNRSLEWLRTHYRNKN